MNKEINLERKEMKVVGILIVLVGIAFVVVNYGMFKISFLDFYEAIILGVLSLFIFVIGLAGYLFPDKMRVKNPTEAGKTL